MEKKTMGSFLAALRRANGMTQVRRILRLFRSLRRYSA